MMRHLAMLLAVFFGASLVRAETGTPPNVILIFADDLGHGDLGCYGARGWSTPHLDRLARQGRRFTDFYAAQAVCSASRAALLTGCYPNRVGILGALGPSTKTGISDKETTLAELLRARGYATAIYGKWHLGHQPPFLPTRHGFDDYYGLPYSNDMWPKHPTSKFPALPLIEGEKVIATDPDQSKLTTAYTERAVRFIEKHRDRPFFLYLPHSMPHVPLFVSARHAGKSVQGLYGDVIEEIDWSVGQILATLARLKLDERTLVIFTSDNGPWLSYGHHAGGTGGLREGKGTNFEGGVRVPCLMRWPGRIPAGSVCHEPAMTIDLFPTIAQIVGARLPTHPIDGRSVLPLIEGRAGAHSPQPAYFFWWGRELQAMRSGKWKLHFPHEYRSMEGQKPGQDGKPGPYAQKHTPLALYDLEADRAETVNLVARHPEVVERLKKLADAARADLGDSATKVQGKGVRAPGKVAP
ncbi:MAG: sulfatase [Gemmataceae bacterium]